MSIQRPRPIDTLQNILSSFKQFEKKLDKLQDDVNYHGHTLSELHVLLANMSGGNILSNFNNNKLDDVKKLVNKTTAMHHDSNFYHEKPIKTKRKSTIQPIPSKLTSKSFQGQRNGINATRDAHSHIVKVPTSPKIVLSGKHISRQRKGDLPRKVLRPRKMDKKQNLVP